MSGSRYESDRTRGNYGSDDWNPRDNRPHPYRREGVGSRYSCDESRRFETKERGDRSSWPNRDHGDGYFGPPPDTRYGDRDGPNVGNYIPDDFECETFHRNQRDGQYSDEFDGSDNRFDSGPRGRGDGTVNYDQMDIPRRQDVSYNCSVEYMDDGFNRNKRFYSQGQTMHNNIDFDQIDIPRQQDVEYSQRSGSPNLNYSRDRSSQSIDYNTGHGPSPSNYHPKSRSRVQDSHKSRPPQNKDHNARDRRQDMNSRKRGPPQNSDRNIKEVCNGRKKEPAKNTANNLSKSQSRNTNNVNQNHKSSVSRNTTNGVKVPQNKPNAKEKEVNSKSVSKNTANEVTVSQNKPNVKEIEGNPTSDKNGVSGNANQKTNSTPNPSKANQVIPKKNSCSISQIKVDQVENDSENDRLNPSYDEMVNNDDQIFKSESLDKNSKMTLIFLNHALFTAFVKGYRAHCTLLVKNYFEHRNALKIIQYEVRKLLDQPSKKPEATNKDWTPAEIRNMKKTKLEEAQKQALERINALFGDCSEEETAKRATFVDACVETLVSAQYPEELCPKPEDYVTDPNRNPSENDLKADFQWQFVTSAYNLLGLQLLDEKPSREKLPNLNRFHLDDGALAALLVESVRIYKPNVKKVLLGKVTIVGEARKILKHAEDLSYLKHPDSIQTYNKQLANNAKFQTRILDFLQKDEDSSTSFVRDVANMVLLFDQAMTVLQYKLVQNVASNDLSPDIRKAMFDQMVEIVYREAIKIWRSGESLADRKFDCTL